MPDLFGGFSGPHLHDEPDSRFCRVYAPRERTEAIASTVSSSLRLRTVPPAAVTRCFTSNQVPNQSPYGGRAREHTTATCSRLDTQGRPWARAQELTQMRCAYRPSRHTKAAAVIALSYGSRCIWHSTGFHFLGTEFQGGLQTRLITTLERRAGCALASYRTRNPHYGSDSLTVRRTTRIYRAALLVRWNRAYGISLSSSTFLVQLSTRPRSKTERH